MNIPGEAMAQVGIVARVQPTFVLLFAVTPAADGAVTAAPAGLQPIPDDVAAGYRERIETGFVAASIATWYYASELGAVLAWTIGVTLVTALGIAALLRWTMNH